MSRIKRFIRKHLFKKELTPKGECLRRYLIDLLNGSENHITSYDEIIYNAQESLKQNFGFNLSFIETVELMSSYFSEYYEKV